MGWFQWWSWLIVELYCNNNNGNTIENKSIPRYPTESVCRASFSYRSWISNSIFNIYHPTTCSTFTKYLYSTLSFTIITYIYNSTCRPIRIYIYIFEYILWETNCWDLINKICSRFSIILRVENLCLNQFNVIHFYFSQTK